jgi:hypothetical protein
MTRSDDERYKLLQKKDVKLNPNTENTPKNEKNLNNLRCNSNTHVPSNTNLAKDIELLTKFHSI